jgi:hypothetical protein
MVSWTCCISGRTFLPLDHDGAIAVDFVAALFKLSQRDLFRADDVFLGMLDRLADVDQATPGGEQGLEFGGGDGWFLGIHGDAGLCLIFSHSRSLYRHVTI